MAFDDLQFPLSQSGSRPTLMLKIEVGRLIGWLAPRRVTRVLAGDIPPRIGFLDRAVVAHLVDKHAREGTLDQLAPLHAWLWKGDQAVSFHAQAKARFDSFWLTHHVAIVEPLRQIFGHSQDGGSTYRVLCEIGCGSGLVLEDIARRLPSVERLVGLDLSERQTELNKSHTLDPRICFESGDATEWIPRRGCAGTVYLTVAGVFEYFPRNALQKLFAGIAANQSPAAVALIEPVPADYDFDNEVASRPYGFENSMGHNYPRLLSDAGFRICFQEKQIVEQQTYLLLVAKI
jgi:trans-aconitate methyltransferase